MPHTSSPAAPRIPAARPIVNTGPGAAMSGGAIDTGGGPPAPRQQCGEVGDLMISDASQHISEPSLWIDVVKFGRLNQRQHDGSTFAAAIRTREQPSFSPERNASQRTLCRVVT